MIVIDSHLDLGWSALSWNRDLTLDISEMRKAESGMTDKHRGANTVSFAEMRKGEIAVCLATVLARVSRLGDPMLDFRSHEIAYAVGKGQLAFYRISEKQGHLKMLRNRRELREHIAKWSSQDHSTLPLGYILSMEGADPIVSPADVTEWWDEGLRVVGLAHYDRSAYAHGTGFSGGLTAKGRELLEASHNNCRALVPGARQFTDDQIRELIRRDSVIGAAFDSWMLTPGWVLGSTPVTAVSFENVADHIDHVCQLAGNSQHAGIGSDLDGGFGREQSPHDLDTIADLQALPAILCKRGYSDSDIEGIMHANWVRFFERAWAKN
jgi:membrane dipeptidase